MYLWEKKKHIHKKKHRQKTKQERTNLPRNKYPHTKKILKCLEEQEKNATDKVRKESLQWEVRIIKQAIKQFPKIEQLYETHKQTTLPLILLKFEHDRNLEELMPQCSLEQLGGYEPLS